MDSGFRVTRVEGLEFQVLGSTASALWFWAFGALPSQQSPCLNAQPIPSPQATGSMRYAAMQPVHLEHLVQAGVRGYGWLRECRRLRPRTLRSYADSDMFYLREVVDDLVWQTSTSHPDSQRGLCEQKRPPKALTPTWRFMGSYKSPSMVYSL